MGDRGSLHILDAHLAYRTDSFLLEKTRTKINKLVTNMILLLTQTSSNSVDPVVKWFKMAIGYDGCHKSGERILLSCNESTSFDGLVVSKTSLSLS